MTLLHDYFNTRNLQGFQRLLDGSAERGQSVAGGPSSGAAGSYTGGGGKPWNRTGGMTGHSNRSVCDVNARDWLGRTTLHLACSSLESIEYVRSLLKHPQISVNLPDVESLWTPLHRALYAANIPAALLLLQRSDIDASLKDLEGYTAFDLYNSTVNGTKPDTEGKNAELFTWGANRNAALGLGDGDDRTYPDHVNVTPKEDPAILAKISLSVRFSQIHVRQVQMSKLHTAVVTTENEGNLRLCGFGSGGRLGPAQHTQYSLKPLPNFNLPIIRVALGQDHTLALTKSGEVYSWGLNRFAQLGYVVEHSSTATGRHEEPIQNVPKRVVGLLRREIVRGIAASKNASACWTDETVFTWGTNTGQLGYDKNAQPIQVLPRPVTKFTRPVIDLAMSDTVLVALLVARHVECIWNDRHYRISFPMQAFPSDIQPYRPPQSVKDSHISKVACCDDTFAALSSNGEVFTFSAPSSSSVDASTGEGRGPTFKPQRVWALRKKFSAVKDVALGSDGSIIICTESGHVFVRTRSTTSASGKAFKFERIPFLQRVTQVCANSTGAFGALRIDYEPNPIEVTGNMIAQDLQTVQPYLQFYQESEEKEVNSKTQKRTRSRAAGDLASSLHFDDEPADAGIENDIDSVLDLCDVLAGEQRMRKAGGGSVKYEGLRLPHGADTMIHVQSAAVFPVHRVILAARSQGLESLLSGSNTLIDQHSNLSIKLLPAKPGPGLGVFKLTRLTISGCHPLSVLIFLRYLYSDSLIALWDRRVSTAVEKQLAALDVNPGRVKTDLQALARLLDLSLLAYALQPSVKREPAPSLVQDMRHLFDAVQTSLPRTSPLVPDVILQLADKEVHCHSVILRARSPLFASFFDLEDWTVKRWEADGMIRVNMKHLRWHVMRFVLGFMCCGRDAEMFYVLDFINSVEDLLHFMFEVLAGANELLLDRLVLLCSSVILAHSNIHSACFILADATYYHVQPLIEKLQEYITVNMEYFLERRILDEIPYALVKQLAKLVRLRQIEKSPFSRSDAFVNEMLKKHAGWLELQDLPEAIVKSISKGSLRKDGSSAKVSPPVSNKKVAYKISLTSSPKASANVASQHVLRRPPSGDDIFMMDEPESPGATTSQPDIPLASPPVWKAHGVPRVDMKAVMAEEASQSQPAGPSRHPSVAKIQTLRPATTSRVPSSTQLSGEPSSSLTPKSSSRPGAPMTWRMGVDQTGLRTPPATPPTPSPLTGSSLPKDGARPPMMSSMSATRPQAPTTSSRSQPSGLGRVITPTRQALPKSGPSNVRNAPGFGGKTWTLPPVQPVAAPSPPTSDMSFVAIQHSQREQVTPVMDKRSLREIQEEERSLQAEADFLKWWTAEEERVRHEALALAQFRSNVGKSSPRKPGNTKQKAEGKERAESTGGSGQATQNTEKRPSQHHAKRKPRKPSQKGNADS